MSSSPQLFGVPRPTRQGPDSGASGISPSGISLPHDVGAPFQAAASAVLPLRLGRQPPVAAQSLGEPVGVGRGLEPGDAHDRLVRIPEGRVLPPRRLRHAAARQEPGVLEVAHRRARHAQRSHLDLVRRLLVHSPFRRAHHEAAAGNELGGGSDDRVPTSDWSCNRHRLLLMQIMTYSICGPVRLSHLRTFSLSTVTGNNMTRHLMFVQRKVGA